MKQIRKIFKIILVTFLIIAIGLDFYFVSDGILTAIKYRELTGSGRAQAGMFTLGLAFVSGPIGVISLILLILNGIIDLKFKDFKFKYSLPIYIGLIVLILIPIFIPNMLLEIMWSGWK